MKVKQYLEEKRNTSNMITFIITKVEKDEHTPFYHSTYTTTPIRYVDEWVDGDVMDYIILNDKQNPIDWLSGANWNTFFQRGDLTCMLVISQEDMYKLFSKEQADHMEAYIDTLLRGE